MDLVDLINQHLFVLHFEKDLMEITHETMKTFPVDSYWDTVGHH